MLSVPRARRVWLVGLALALGACKSPDEQACSDGVLDHDETGVDCGGPACDPCPDGARCAFATDCVSNLCTNTICGASVAPGCANGQRDSNETDLDCGGASCPPCADGRQCATADDCASGLCTSVFRCATPSCTDGLEDGDEAGVDCGGSCPRCAEHRDGAGARPATGELYALATRVLATPPASGGCALTAFTAGALRFECASGDGDPHEVWGSFGSAATLAGVAPGCNGACASDYVTQAYADGGGTRVDFDLALPAAASATVGFDLTVSACTEAQPLYLDLILDGARTPSALSLIAAPSSQPIAPEGLPFGAYVP